MGNLGTGIQQLLSLAYHLVTDTTAVLILEEPESHLHPRAQRALLQAIRHAARQGKQIFLSTHSPLFVDRWQHHHNWNIVLNDQGRTEVNPLTRTPDPLNPIRQSLGVSVGDTLFAGDVVLVEGTSEQVCLPLLIQKAAIKPETSWDWERLAIINAGGAANVPAMTRIVSGFRLPVVVLVDHDNAGRQAIKSCLQNDLIKNSHMVYAGVAEGRTDGLFENELSAPDYLAGMEQIYDVSIPLSEIEDIQNCLAAMRQNHMPSIVECCQTWLKNNGLLHNMEDYRKVDIALATCERINEISKIIWRLQETLDQLFLQYRMVL